MANEVVVLGVAISLIYAEITGFSPAGIIVPGYLVLSLKDPWRIVYTLFIALLTVLVFKIISNYTIVYGRRQFALTILISFCLNFLIIKSNIISIDYGIIGVLIPGILANEFQRQGIPQSLLSLGVVMGILTVVMVFLSVPIF